MIEGLTARIFTLIEQSIERRGYAPSMRELMKATGITSTNGVRYHLCALERQGWIARTHKVARGIRVLRKASAA